MHAVLLDFNGTMFFDTRFHMEAWSKIYHELHPEDKSPLASTKICGPCNDVILKNMAPWLTPAERSSIQKRKRRCTGRRCRNDPASLHLVQVLRSCCKATEARHPVRAGECFHKSKC